MYLQIAGELRQTIYDRRLRPGDQIPSQHDLIGRFGCAKDTAAKALEVLKREGLVWTEPGRGSFVRSIPLIHLDGSTRYLREQRPPGSRPFQAEAEREGHVADQDVRAVERVVPQVDVAMRLEVDEAEVVLVRRHLLKADDVPVATVDSYYRLVLAEGTKIEQPERIEGGVHGYLIDTLGLRLDHFTEEVSARQSTDEFEILRLRHDEPILRILRTLYDSQQRPVQVSDQRWAGDKTVSSYNTPLS
jgi:GntR family transcriptional regulator